MDSNRLCLDEHYQFTDKGVTALCEGLKGSAVTTLRCAVGPKAFAFLSMPTDMSDLSPFPLCPSLGSLSWNSIGEEGASALAAILKETKITNLKCAALFP